MINRLLLISSFFTLFGISSLQSAQFALFNLASGPGPAGDTLWANSNGTLMNGSGIVTIGYFNTAIVDSDINTISKLVSNLAGFVAIQTSTPNIATSPNPETIATEAGYVGNDFTSIGAINSGNALINRRIYAIATSASSLGVATLSDAFSLFYVNTIVEDTPEQQYVANPAGATPIIGTNSVINGHTSTNYGLGNYNTLNMSVIPEPSSLMLAALGAFALLRRRR